ncbi:hypothetical protein [Salinimonas marina]|uniref:hypothetical protein n=1 Tax=Salinimonas marina TaxID=2785918 RepID=UPI001C550905|nr:hypothetical protein [Salinimonas marina]
MHRQSQQVAQMGLLFQFNTLINVRPNNTSAQLTVESIDQQDGEWLVAIANSGNSYGRLTAARLNISDGVNTKILKGQKISEYIKGTLVLPNSIRYFKMTPLVGFNIDNTLITIE